MDNGQRRCQAILLKRDERGGWICISSCWWRRGHPDRHWAMLAGVVERWADTDERGTYV